MTKFRWLLVLIAFGFLFLLRFLALGYSDFIPDETTVMFPVKEFQVTGVSPFNFEFFMQQRKGPVQFLVVYLISMMNISVYNGFLYRLPFVFANLIGLYFFFLFVKRVTEDYWVALISTVLLGMNGMVVGFGRIVQYQSFNILFSGAALYFFSKPKFRLNPLTGVFFALSLLSHWDAVFILPIMVIYLIKYRYYKEKAWILVNGATFLAVLLPFLIPYIQGYLANLSNQAYFASRVGFVAGNFNLTLDALVSKTLLYNPFLYGPLMIIGMLASLLTFKKVYPFLIWFLVDFLFFALFVKSPGTHLYNLFIPGAIVAGYGLFNLLDKAPELVFKYLVGFSIFASFFFLYNQNYLIFTQVRTEYPWEREKIYKYKTVQYSAESLTNNIIGFPIKRGWYEIRNYIAYHGDPDSTYFYVTNENKSIANFYLSDLNLAYGEGSGKYYAIGVKRPLSFANDYSFPQIKNKEVVHRISIGGNTTARIYLVEP